MTLVYIIIVITIVHAIFLLYPVYRDEALDVYSWTPWTEHEYVLYKKVTGNNNKAVKIRFLINWLIWPFLLLFIIVMPLLSVKNSRNADAQRAGRVRVLK